MTTKYECLGDARPFPNDQEDAPAPEGAALCRDLWFLGSFWCVMVCFGVFDMVWCFMIFYSVLW